MAHIYASRCALRPNSTRLRREQPTSYSIYLLWFGVFLSYLQLSISLQVFS